MSFLSIKVGDVRFTEDELRVALRDGRTITVPLAWYPTLLHASAAERSAWEPCGAGSGIHWTLLDYHLSAYGLLQGYVEAGPGVSGALVQQT